MSNPPLISLKEISHRYDQQWMLENISLDLCSSEITTLIGPNGAGKSTLVRIILGLLNPSKGTISRRPALRIGYTPQHLRIDHTVPITVKRFLQLAGKPSSRDIDIALSQVDAKYTLHSAMQSLSGGEFQRVLLARTLLKKSDLLVLDEPAQGVDLAGQNALYQLIKDIRDEQGCAVLMVSHDLHLVMSATDHVICLNHHVCCSGHPDSVSEHPAYLEIFGKQAINTETDQLATYTHHHDHEHDIAGDVSHQHSSSCEHAPKSNQETDRE